MKKYINLLWIAAAVSAVSCNKEMTASNLSAQEFQLELGATIEQPADGNKTSLGAGNTILWSMDDAISVITASQNAKFTVKSVGDPATSARFSGELTEASQYYALYPYQENASLKDGSVCFSVPQEQKYVSGSFASGAFVSIAAFTDPTKNLQFKNIFGLVKLSLTGNSTLTKIALVDESGTMLWGDCSVVADENIGTGLQQLTLKDGNNMIFLTDIDVTLSSTATDFFFAVPAGALKEGLTAYLYNGDSIFSILSTSADNETIRSTILKMPATDTPAIDGFNLSSRATSNCYIAPAAGNYIFTATKGYNGDAVTASKVAVLWEGVGTTTKPQIGSIVSACSVSGQVISVTTTGTKGNALVAAYDASNNVIWSWHIWCPGEPVATKKYSSGTGAYIMDRNVGALSKTPGDYLCAGCGYQYGRKDPFPIAGVLGTTSGVTTVAVTNPEIIMNKTAGGTYAYANAHPNELLYGQAQWTTAIDVSAWWNNGVKTVYDPCPAGYIMVTKDDVTSLAHSKFDTSKLGMLLDNTEWYQFSAGRDAKTGVGKNIGKYLYLQTSTMDSGTSNYYLFGNTSSTLEPRTSSNLASASPTRCKKIK